MPGRTMSAVYFAAPVTLAGPSRRRSSARSPSGPAIASPLLALLLFPLVLLLLRLFEPLLPTLLHRIFRAGLRHLEHGLADARIGAAAAEVARQAVMDLGERGSGVAVEEGLGRDDEAGGAEAALLGVVLDEGG